MQDFLRHASKKYYEGQPIISDEQFDALVSVYKFHDVGYRVTDGVAHYFPMRSLQKFFSIEDAPDLGLYVNTPKLDGAAVSLLYVSGKLQQALTRGDGKLGKDITSKMRHLVPGTIQFDSNDVLQITGEVVAPIEIPNARNYASGALNLKDEGEFLERNINFVAYDAQPAIANNWTTAMKILMFNGFATVDSVQKDTYPTDGEVFRVNSYATYENMGYTAHHPKGAFALKEQKEGVVTRLLDVKWQVGKSGEVSPVALLEPVKIGDAEVSRATLHNIEYIRGLNLEIGCEVEVIRSGEIIPRILRRVDSDHLSKNNS